MNKADKYMLLGLVISITALTSIVSFIFTDHGTNFWRACCAIYVIGVLFILKAMVLVK